MVKGAVFMINIEKLMRELKSQMDSMGSRRVLGQKKKKKKKKKKT